MAPDLSDKDPDAALIDICRVAAHVGITPAMLAKDLDITGIPSTSPLAQERLRDFQRVLSRTIPRYGSAKLSWKRIRSLPLPGFGVTTALELINQGMAQEVISLYDAVDAGGHA